MSVFYEENDTWGVTVCRIVGGLIGAFIAVAVGKELGENGRWVYRIGCIIGAGIGGAIGGAIGSGVKSISSRSNDKKTTGDNATPAEVIFVCPHCGQNKTVSREFIGLHTRCPRCQQTYSTADARNRLQRDGATADYQYQMRESGNADKRNSVSKEKYGIEFCCPHCGQIKTVPREFIGLHTRCPRCQQTYSTADARNRFFRVSAAEEHQYRKTHKVDESDPFVVLGIPYALSVQEKKRKLRELFAKWNSLQTHKDPEMRRKAEKMINTIAECQKHLLSMT